MVKGHGSWQRIGGQVTEVGQGNDQRLRKRENEMRNLTIGSRAVSSHKMRRGYMEGEERCDKMMMELWFEGEDDKRGDKE